MATRFGKVDLQNLAEMPLCPFKKSAAGVTIIDMAPAALQSRAHGRVTMNAADKGQPVTDERLNIEVAPVEVILFLSAHVAVAEFRCGPGHPHFSGTGPLRHSVVGFPRRASYLRVNEANGFVATANEVVLMNAGDVYSRRKVHDDGDISIAIALSNELLAGIMDEVAPARLDRLGEPKFDRNWLPITAQDFAWAARISSPDYASSKDDDAFEETIAHRIGAILGRAGSGTVSSRLSFRKRRIVERAKGLMIRHPGRQWTLKSLGEQLLVSPFHLSHVFAEVTGQPVHQFLLQLRLKRAFELIGEGKGEIGTVAMALGFSSHSHFTNAFSRAFGLSPNSLRARN